MSGIQRLREQLERALVRATSRRDERAIGKAIVELQETADFTEIRELRGSVQLPPEFSLPSHVTERSVVPPV